MVDRAHLIFRGNDKSEKLRHAAQRALEQVEVRRASDQRRRQLPNPLRGKTERHPGRWVYVQDGRIVGADLTRKMRRHFPDAESYYVWPAASADGALAHVGSEPSSPAQVGHRR